MATDKQPEQAAEPETAPAPPTVEPSGWGMMYRALAAPFLQTMHDTRGGIAIEYVTGEQVISRLNRVLGPCWDFAVIEDGLNVEADEAWAHGRLTVRFPALTMDIPRVATGEARGERLQLEPQVSMRDQYGSQKIKRSRNSGQPIDIGFDLKGAATDALKKCAMAYGVGLYLAKKEGTQAQPAPQSKPAAPQAPTAAPQAPTAAPTPQGGTQSQAQPEKPQNRPQTPPVRRPDPVPERQPEPEPERQNTQGQAYSEALDCADCGNPVLETRFRDGTVWPPAQLAGYGRRKHNRVLCMDHYRAANEARRRAERSLEEVPF